MIYSDFLDQRELSTLATALNSRAKAAGIGGTVTGDGLRDRIYASGGQCAWCACGLVGLPFEVDHIIPLNRGGGNIADNLAVACPDCNRRKSDKHPARFAQETYARTGVMTALLERVLSHYEADALTQQGLFDTPQDTPSIADDEPSDDPPPYVWE